MLEPQTLVSYIKAQMHFSKILSKVPGYHLDIVTRYGVMMIFIATGLDKKSRS